MARAKKIVKHTEPDKRDRDERVFFTIEADPDKEYNSTAWYRCVGVHDFIDKVEDTNKIVGVVISGNNIGFILSPKN